MAIDQDIEQALAQCLVEVNATTDDYGVASEAFVIGVKWGIKYMKDAHDQAIKEILREDY